MEQVLLPALGFILEVFSSPYGLRQTGLYIDATERGVRMCLGSIGFFGFSSACISHVELWIRIRLLQHVRWGSRHTSLICTAKCVWYGSREYDVPERKCKIASSGLVSYLKENRPE